MLGTEEDNGASDGAVVGVGEEGCQAFDDVARNGHMPVAAFVVCRREVGVFVLVRWPCVSLTDSYFERAPGLRDGIEWLTRVASSRTPS